MEVRFWSIHKPMIWPQDRGPIPVWWEDKRNGSDLEIVLKWLREQQPREGTKYGGTNCISVKCGNALIILWTNMPLDDFHDGYTGTVEMPHDSANILAHALPHPDPGQRAFGFRITYRTVSLAFTSGFMWYTSSGIHQGFKPLINGALWVTDCECAVKRGRSGRVRPLDIGSAALHMQPQSVIIMDQTPKTGYQAAKVAAREIESLSGGILTIPGYRGLVKRTSEF